jgi:hypothetical protein
MGYLGDSCTMSDNCRRDSFLSHFIDLVIDDSDVVFSQAFEVSNPWSISPTSNRPLGN